MAKKKKLAKKSGGGSNRRGGSMMSLRSGIKGLVGTGKKPKGPKSAAQKAWDVLFWILLAAAAGWVVYTRFIR